MPATSLKAKKQFTPLQRFVGEDMQIVSCESHSISNVIMAEWTEVALPDDNQREDRGKLFLFPVDDLKFSLRLCFLQYPEAPGANAAVCMLQFMPAFFDQYAPETLMANQPFRFDQTTEQDFPICAKTRLLLAQLQQQNDALPFIRSLQQSEVALSLLRCSLECLTQPLNECQVPACRFLAHESEREKIHEARLLMEQHIDRPFTIPELARKVAINECYLKKGFKAMVGKTVHEYQQELRINKAKQLLQLQGHTVTDVANILGYSSISHFSTAFKRITGMKPCELLA